MKAIVTIELEIEILSTDDLTGDEGLLNRLEDTLVEEIRDFDLDFQADNDEDVAVVIEDVTLNSVISC